MKGNGLTLPAIMRQQCRCIKLDFVCILGCIRLRINELLISNEGIRAWRTDVLLDIFINLTLRNGFRLLEISCQSGTNNIWDWLSNNGQVQWKLPVRLIINRSTCRPCILKRWRQGWWQRCQDCQLSADTILLKYVIITVQLILSTKYKFSWLAVL